jgi:hypothetical protein
MDENYSMDHTNRAPPLMPMNSQRAELCLIWDVTRFLVLGQIYPVIFKEQEVFRMDDTVYSGQGRGNALIIVDPNTGCQAGVVYDDYDLTPLVPGFYSFLKLSQTTLRGVGDSFEKEVNGEPGQADINPEAEPPPVLDRVFDVRRYDWHINWGLYNVLMVRMVPSVTRYRSGHVGVFQQ